MFIFKTGEIHSNVSEKERKKLIKWMKKEGILYFKDGETEIKLVGVDPSSIKKNPSPISTDMIPEDKEARMPSDSAMLFWSTDHFEQLQDAKKDT